tara:strand:+ start:98 stop:841 length:744 start_codon:yes stop_codon:yes gene_type:complete
VEGRNPILVALDGMSKHEALTVVEAVSPYVGGFKLNSALHHSDMGTAFAIEMAEFGLFSDVKTNDTPRTVQNTILDIATTKPIIVTLHLTNSVEALIAARKAMEKVREENNVDITLAGITVLTSICEEECNILMGGPVKAVVLERARRAVLSGIPAIVGGGAAIGFLKQFEELKGLKKIVPALYPEWYPSPSDQKQPMTPGDAIRAGADWLVIGSAITKSFQKAQITSKEAAKRIHDEVEAAMAEAA